MFRRFGARHISYMMLMGLSGWAAVIYVSAWGGTRFAEWSITTELLAVAAMTGVARSLSSRVIGRVRIAVDSMFYVALYFVYGTVPAAWIVLVLLTVDGIARIARSTAPVPTDEAPRRYRIAYVVHNGGLPAGVMVLAGLLFGDHSLYIYTDYSLATQVPLFAAFFLVLYYTLAAVSGWWLGIGVRTLITSFYVPALTAELTLVPLTLAMVMSYKHQGLLLFMLLASTGLIFNFIFRRMNTFARSLHKRVEELSVLNNVSRIIANSNDRPTLYRSLAAATLDLVGDASRFMIGLRSEGTNTVDYAFFNSAGECYRELTAEAGEGLSGWVMQQRKPLILGDASREYEKYVKDQKYNDPRFNSWLAVPLVVYEEVVGVMSVQAEARRAYTLDHLRVMTAISDQAAVALENSRLYQLATVDGLTGLFVRRYFDQRLIEEWHRGRRYENPFCLGLFDLDNFKRINDTYGHQFGDTVLRATARAVRSNMRSFDLAARYGGEEFAFILPRTMLRDAVAVAERIRRDVAALDFEAPGGGALSVTASIGIAASDGENLSEVQDLLAMADAGLYEAKAAGKNRVTQCTVLRQPAASSSPAASPSAPQEVPSRAVASNDG